MPSPIELALPYVGTHTGSPLIAKWLAVVGLKIPSAWCAAFAVSMLVSANPQTHILRTGRSSALWRTAVANPFRYQVLTSQDWAFGVGHPQPNDIAIFTHDNEGVVNFNGHTALVEVEVGHQFRSVEGNTSGLAGGSQWAGGTVARKVRHGGIKGFQLIGFLRLR